MPSALRSVALAAALAIPCVPASAQRAPFTGYELALSGSADAPVGRSARFRGVAYRVRGLAELVPYPRGRVRARFAHGTDFRGPAVEVRADASGAFVADVPIPEGEWTRGAHLAVEIGPEDDARELTFAMRAVSPYDVMLRADRRLYEPGEPVHLWALVRDARSGRPVVGRSIELTVSGAPLAETTRTLTTSDAGVAELRLELSRTAPEGHVSVALSDGAMLRASTSFSVGTRTWERMLAEVELEPREVAPHAEATARVRVTTASGAPVRDAHVEVIVDGGQPIAGTTGPEGRADIAVRAPAYLEHETGAVSVVVRASHPAHGAVQAFGTLRIAVPLALQTELVPRHGALVPEVDDVVYVRLRDGLGHPPAVGTELEIEGPAVRGGRVEVRTDENGLAEVPVRLPRGASSSQGDRSVSTLLVRVRGPLERLARMSVEVRRDAEVVPSLSRSVLAPGERVEVAIARRPAFASRAVVIELLDSSGEPMLVARAASGTSRVELTLPPDRIGLFSVRARVVHEDESLEGIGALERLVVRPAQPGFVRLEPVRERWTVGETARVRIHTPAGAPQSFAAVLVRDLAAHGGEERFARSFLEGAFDRAVLDPTGPGAERLVRAALAAHAGEDAAPNLAPPLVDELGLPSEGEGEASAPARGELRDPWPASRELARRGVGPAMLALEQRLEEALVSGALDELTEGAGARRRFRDEPLDDHETLGGAPITPSILEQASPGFTYERVSRRVARARLVSLMVALSHYLDPGEDASPRARMAAEEPSARWLPRMVERGMIEGTALDDPWGGRFVLRETSSPRFALSPHAARLELVSPGPDGRAGTADDVRDPFERAVPAATPYAVASGEDALMRRLAILSPAARTLAAITDAYGRTNAEVLEEEIGDAVTARVSEGTIGLGNLGTIGHGGGSGSGYGRGAGGLRGRMARTPSIRMGSASVSGLARVVRERFPPTLLFRPSVRVDPSGTTEIEIPLADAVTTYLVEAIVWREDGWIWSHHTRIEVDRDIVVDAPVPDVARIGDRLMLPLRVSNRSDRARELRVALLPEPALGLGGSEPATLTVPAGGALVVPVEVRIERAGEGQLSVVVSTPEGEALDAVRRPLRVIAPARRVHVERDALSAGDGSVELVVPEGADPRRGRVRLAVGLALIEAPGAQPWASWAPGGPAIAWDGADADPVTLAFRLGGASRDRELREQRLQSGLIMLTTRLDALGRDAGDGAVARARAMSLLGLAPLVTDADTEASSEASALLDRLAREVSADAVGATDDPATWVTAAAALGWSAPGTHRDRIAELVRRLERHTVEVGEDRWLPTADAPLRSTVLLAMAELSLGRRERAFVLLRTLARWAVLGHVLPADVLALARATAQRLMGEHAPTEAVVEVDGVREELPLIDGAIERDAPALARAGRHIVRVTTARGAPLFVRIDADYGLPWTADPPRPGPLALRFEGETGALDEVSRLELVVRNRAPRTIPRPVVEIDLPTGAELTAHDRSRVRSLARDVTRADGVLTLRLAPLRPGNEVRIPLPVRWSVEGRLRGLGTVAYADDRPEDITVLAPRELSIEASEGGVSR